ncbi:hypothetical protein ABZT47_22445 [Sphaerisporangium sp. NPDC005289]|uniref:hypothetical protein n=1 Tax=Sphaerisporangium sp. NPDC005289 TaxID=3155247 RepID=UPI00339E5653
MRKSTTAISAGALTLALASGTALLVAAPAVGSATGAHGCERGGAALSGLTGGVCDLLDQVGVPGADAGKPVTGAESGTGTATGTATGTGTGTEPGTGTGSGTGTGTGARSETGSGLSDREREPEEGAAGPSRDGLKPLTDAVSGLTGDALKPVTDKVEDLADDALKPVTDTVSDLGGDGLKPLTDQVEKTADKLTGRGHRSSPTAAPASRDTPDTPDADPSPSPGGARDGSGDDDLLGVPIDTDCLPLVGSADCGEEGAPSTSKPPTNTDADRSTPSAAPSATPRGGGDDGDDGGAGGKDRSPGEPPAGQQGPPQIVDRPGPPVDRATPAARASHPPSADVESPPMVPLWPGLPLPSLLGDPRARTAVPERPYDVVGTALTAVLLASAILAARIVQSRRDSDAPRSMPFEGMSHPDNGRHRLA